VRSGREYGSGYGSFGTGNERRYASEMDRRHFNYEDESQETPRTDGRQFSTGYGAGAKRKSGDAAPERSVDNIARFFGGKAGGRPGALARPAMNPPAAQGATGLKQGQRVRHSKYGEGTVMMREGEGEDAKLTVVFPGHGMKKLMEKFANLEKL